ncbi:MAG: RsmB/NOP family class I SAM-dependent RNA methyltransferase [Coriobacteriaceae bacterium]|nr:RsmB/NOP family class I SAM-dependent RNA methyltransferase [Coriobacteriaceae bacterium]
MYLSDKLDETTRELALAGYEQARERPVTLRANTLKASAEQIASELDAAGISYERVAWYKDAFVLPQADVRAVWDLDIYREGHIYLQSLSSMLPPLLLGPHPGADILDMCAAPGGKTSQIAALVGNNAHITACEMSAPRAEKLDFNLKKLGAANVNIMRTDARKLDEFFRFDQILLDAPCTGTGTVRAGDEKAERRITEQLLAKVVKSQRALLDRALTVLKPGGTLIYSTCSILQEENGDQVRAALKRHRDCSIVPIAVAEPGADIIEGAEEANAARPITLENAATGPFALPVLERETDVPGTLTLAPSRVFEGFYVAAIQKSAQGAKRGKR